MQQRIAKKVETPILANVLALESRDGDRSLDAAILVSCAVVFIPESVSDMVRTETRKRVPGFDVKKLVLSAIHTHFQDTNETKEETTDVSIERQLESWPMGDALTGDALCPSTATGRPEDGTDRLFVERSGEQGQHTMSASWCEQP